MARIRKKLVLHAISIFVVSVSIFLDAWHHGLDFWKVVAIPVAIGGVEAIYKLAEIKNGNGKRCDR